MIQDPAVFSSFLFWTSLPPTLLSYLSSSCLVLYLTTLNFLWLWNLPHLEFSGSRTQSQTHLNSRCFPISLLGSNLCWLHDWWFPLILDVTTSSFLLILVFSICNTCSSNYGFMISDLVLNLVMFNYAFSLSALEMGFFHHKGIKWVLCLDLVIPEPNAMFQ